MEASATAVIPTVIARHAEEAAMLRDLRSQQVDAADVRLFELARLDERLAAHLDGISVAGEAGLRCCAAALEDPGVGEVFVATVRALETHKRSAQARLIEFVMAKPECRGGLISAFGWVSAEHLQGTVADYLGSADPIHRWLGIAACAMHRVDPGEALATALADPHPALRARSLRAAGECGRRDLRPACLASITDEDPHCRLRAATSAVLLGERGAGLDALRELAAATGAGRQDSLDLYLIAADVVAAHELLQHIAAGEHDPRLLIRGAGHVGDPSYVTWLIGQMDDPARAPLAGESFSLITGADLAAQGLERLPDAEPVDDAGEEEEEEKQAGAPAPIDADQALPRPEPTLVAAWWQRHGAGFAEGKRYFMGRPVSAEHCAEVLREGSQRQRALAARHRCLLMPGESLFNTAAPAWRQRRALAGLVSAR